MKPKIVLATTNSSKIEPFLFSWNQNKLVEKFELLTFKDIQDKLDFEVEEDTGSFETDAVKRYAEFLNSLEHIYGQLQVKYYNL